MKKVVYGTIIVFVAILITIAVIAIQNPPKMVKYENGQVILDE